MRSPVQKKGKKSSIRVNAIAALMERWAPAALAYDWDKVGLQIGRMDQPVERILIALTISQDVVNQALAHQVDLIVAHHPLIWEPLRVLRDDYPDVKVCLDMVRGGIACYIAHTNLDRAQNGMNDVLANRLGLIRTRPLLDAPGNQQVKLVTFVPETHLDLVREAVCNAGAGIIGNYTQCSFATQGMGTFVPGDIAAPFSGEIGVINQEPEMRLEVLVSKLYLPGVLSALQETHPYEEPAYDIVCLENVDKTLGIGVAGVLEQPVSLDVFCETVKTVFELPAVRVVGDLQKEIQSVGILGGSGGSQIRKLPYSLDVYLSGDIGYHDALTASQRGLAVIDAGHAGLERWIVPTIAERIQCVFPEISVLTYAEDELFGVV